MHMMKVKRGIWQNERNTYAAYCGHVFTFQWKWLNVHFQ